MTRPLAASAVLAALLCFAAAVNLPDYTSTSISLPVTRTA
jgi:hypothetical protein